MKYDEAMLYLDTLWDRFEEQSLRSYNHRLNKYYEAKRQVLPDYLNSMPNVPKSSNLFDQIKHLATRLDNSALSIDEIHWNDMMEAKREKWVDKVFNVPKRMLSVLVGRYPMYTYGVNSILTGTIPTRQGYNQYTAHGLGWDDPNHSDLCPAWDRPPLITTIPRNGHGRRVLGNNPFSKENKRLVRQSKELRCFGLTREQIAQVDNAMGRDDVMAFVDELQAEHASIDVMEDDEDGIFDMRDVFHEGEDDVKDSIHKIGDTIRQYYLGQSDRLMLLLNHVCSFRRKLKHGEFLETLDFFGASLGTIEKRKSALSVTNFVMLMYSKLAQYEV